jgi:riboflavin kinase/FMN adenylyltransferase
MQVFNSFDQIRGKIHPKTAVIGNFDGVHLGHVELIRVASSLGHPLVGVTFDPPPLSVLAPLNYSTLLTTLEQKIELLEKAGVNHIVVLEFSRKLASMDALDFATSIYSDLGVSKICIGENFRFGSGRSGTTALLKDTLKGLIDVITVEPLVWAKEPISSTWIREEIIKGSMQEVCNLLGRHYELSGIINAGFGMGRQLGFPTANISPAQLIPGDGVYAAIAKIHERSWLAAVSIGTRCSLNIGGILAVEAHLIGASGDLYGLPLKLEMIEKIREQKYYQDVSDLKTQIALDVECVKDIIERNE